MRLPLLILLLAFSFHSCGHKSNLEKSSTEVPVQSSKISTYLEEWKSDIKPYNEKQVMHVQAYEDYLKSVQSIYTKSGKEMKFNSYLDSLQSNAQVIKHSEKGLPQRFAKEKNKRAVVESAEFQLYKTKVLTGLHDRLNQERVEKIKKETDKELFSKLLNNKQQFHKEYKEAGYLFPL